MSRKTVSAIIMSLLVLGTLALASHIQPAKTSKTINTQLSTPTKPSTPVSNLATTSLQQPPATQWNKTYGGTGDDEAWSMVKTSDGGYILAGFTKSSGAGGRDMWLVKTDAAGNMLWNKTYGGTRTDIATSVVQTGDGGYALAGTTNSSGAGNYDFWLVRTDAAGNMLWNKTYGDAYIDIAESMVQTSDGGYALAGYTYSVGAGDFWLVRTDAAGNMLWNQTYGGTGFDVATSVVQTRDGGYALAGLTDSFGAGNYDFWLVKTDASGNIQWNCTYGGTGDDEAFSVLQTNDEGYALAGYTNSFGAGNYDAWLVKTDAAGNMLWNKTYGGIGDDDAWSVVWTRDGGYALAGTTNSSGAGNYDMWLVKTDVAGNMEWNQTYGGTGYEEADVVVQMSDGSYALAGYTNSLGAGDYDSWLVKTIESGTTRYSWPMFRHDLAHAGFTESPAPNTNQTLWNSPTGGYVESSPAVADGKIYVGSDDGRVYCLDASDGTQIWNFTTGHYVRSSPAVSDGRIYVGSLDDTVYCLDAASGTEVWNYTTGGYVYSSPAVADGKVYVGSVDGRIYCLDAASGTQVWNYTTGNTVVCPPAIVGGRVYGGSDDGRVYCLDALDGTQVWNYTTGNSVHSSPAVVGGRVYVGSDDGRVYCLDALDGTQIWNYTTGNDVYSSPAVADGKVYVGSWDGRIYCLDAATGTEVWNYTTGNDVESSPAVADGKVYVGSLDGRVYCLDAASGTQVWNYMTGNGVWSSPAVADGVVYVGSNDSSVYAFGNVVKTEDYATAQAAIDAATPGATIWVAPGTYSESLTVNKTIAIIGTKGCNPIFHGDGSGTAIALLSGGSGSIITGIVITAWDQGVVIQNSGNCEVYGNMICLMGSSAIVLNGSSGNVISENTISQNAGGINLTASDNNKIYHNNFVGNTVQLSVQSSTGNVWDNGYPSGGNYWSDHTGSDLYSGPNQDQPGSDGIVDTAYTIATGSVDRYPLVHGVHEIGIAHATASKTVVGRGYSLSVVLEISDYGLYDENFPITIYTNTTIAATKNVALVAGEAFNLTLTFDTTYFAYGNYTITACAEPVLNEANVLDNNCTGGWVTVAGVGDLTGGTPNLLDFVPDGIVNMKDVGLVARYFNENVPPAPANCDLTGPTQGVPDGIINMRDVGLVARFFGTSYTYP